MTNQKGSNLIEYIIPIAVIAMSAGLAIYYIGANNLLSKFFSSSTSMKYEKSINKAVIDENKSEKDNITLAQKLNKPGSYGGTAEQPVEECNNGTCLIDFGEFVLTGIPENFEEFVKTQGSSGGTKSFSDLLMQISKQLEKDGDKPGSILLKDMANLGHLIGQYQKNVESHLESCKTAFDKDSCYEDTSYYSQIKIPDSIKQYTSDMVYSNDFQAYQVNFTKINIAKKECSINPDCNSYNLPAYSFIKKYYQFMNNDKRSNKLQKMSFQLYIKILFL